MTNQIVKTDIGPLAGIRHAMVGASKHFEEALPVTVARALTPERLTKVALAAIGRSPRLMESTPESLLRSVMDAASLGLEPSGGSMGHAYLVPYRNNKTGKYEAQLIVGYRGFIELARRSGEVRTVHAHLVYERDEFLVELGSEPRIVHKPRFLGDRGAIIGGYCIADLRDGTQQREIMTIDEIEKIRKRSRAQNGPWQTDFEEMARKTVVRRAAKYWPLSADLARAFDVDDRDQQPPQTVTVTNAQPALPAASTAQPVQGTYDFAEKPKPAPAQEKPKKARKSKTKAEKPAEKPEQKPDPAPEKPAIPEQQTLEVEPPEMSEAGQTLLVNIGWVETQKQFDDTYQKMNQTGLPEHERKVLMSALNEKHKELNKRAQGKDEPGADG